MEVIDIYDMRAGWATLQIGDCIFDVSYLSDLKYELDKLIRLHEEVDKIGYEVNRCILEGEGRGDLSLVSYLTFGSMEDFFSEEYFNKRPLKYDYIINIVWEEMYSDDSKPIVLKFPFKEFVAEYKAMTEDICDRYIHNFLCITSKRGFKKAKAAYFGVSK